MLADVSGDDLFYYTYTLDQGYISIEENLICFMRVLSARSWFAYLDMCPSFHLEAPSPKYSTLKCSLRWQSVRSTFARR